MSARPPRQLRAKRRIFLSILGEALSSEDREDRRFSCTSGVILNSRMD
jgi:hypothetical protein